MARKKKKPQKKEPDNELKELGGFCLNDEVWATYLGGKIIQGRITKLIKSEIEGELACLITPAEGYRTVFISDCSYSIIKKQRVNKLKRK